MVMPVVLLVLIVLLDFGLGVGGSAVRLQPTLHVRSCPVPARYDKYRNDPAYKAAWDEACEVFVTSGVETQPILYEIGPLAGTRICSTVWDPVTATCAPATPHP